MEAQVRACAEFIDGLLADGREVSVLRLTDQLADRSMIVYQAVGWLAREGRLRYVERGRQVYLQRRKALATA